MSALLFLSTVVSAFAFNKVFDLNFLYSMAAPITFAYGPAYILERMQCTRDLGAEKLLTHWLGASAAFALLVGAIAPNLWAAEWVDHMGHPVTSGAESVLLFAFLFQLSLPFTAAATAAYHTWFSRPPEQPPTILN